MITYKPLYEYDNSGRLRVWYMEQAGDEYRTVSGLQDGIKTESAWKKAKPKNIGKSNATTGEEQALLEIKSHYQKRIDRGFSYEIPDINAKSKFFEPMLAHKYESVIFPVYSQPKLDGFRCVVNKNGMWSRNGKPILSSPHIFEELKPVFDNRPDVTFDGELYNHSLKDDFDKLASLVSIKKPTAISIAESADIVEYHIYDVHLSDSSDFEERILALNMLFSNNNFDKIKQVDTTKCVNQEQLDLLYSVYLQDRYEGQMVRNPSSMYEHKRTKNLLKRKEFIDDEFEVLDILEGQGNWAGYAKVVLLKLHDGQTCESGIRGTQPKLAQVLQEKNRYIGKRAKVRFQNYTPEKKLRFPVVVELDRQM